MFSHLDEVEMTRKYRKEHDLLGLELEDLLGDFPELDMHNLETYRYPQDTELQAVGVRGIYINNYLRWDSKAQHELMIDVYGYETATQQRTFDTYNDVDSHHYSGLHDYIKFLKFGYGKATDHATREIRLKRMSREQGLELVRHYQDVVPTDTQLFLDWMDMSADELFTQVDAFRDQGAWRRNARGEWELNASACFDDADMDAIEAARLTATYDSGYRITGKSEPDVDDKSYIIIGKGFVDSVPPRSPISDYTAMPESAAVSE